MRDLTSATRDRTCAPFSGKPESNHWHCQEVANLVNFTLSKSHHLSPLTFRSEAAVTSAIVTAVDPKWLPYIPQFSHLISSHWSQSDFLKTEIQGSLWWTELGYCVLTAMSGFNPWSKGTNIPQAINCSQKTPTDPKSHPLFCLLMKTVQSLPFISRIKIKIITMAFEAHRLWPLSTDLSPSFPTLPPFTMSVSHSSLPLQTQCCTFPSSAGLFHGLALLWTFSSPPCPQLLILDSSAHTSLLLTGSLPHHHSVPGFLCYVNYHRTVLLFFEST